jgi:hypothetical protein
MSGYFHGFGPINALLRLNPANRDAPRQLTARRKQRRKEGRRQSEIKLCLWACCVSGAEDGSIMAGPEGARPPSLDGGEPGDHAGPLISEFSFEVK